jgi:uncharacterized Fe-S cluster-containing protein
MQFAAALAAGQAEAAGCPFLLQDRFKGRIRAINEILSGPARGGEGKAVEAGTLVNEEIVGLIDHLGADFVLSPFDGETSCKEDLHPFDRNIQVEIGDIIRYRPWGCPVTHFAEILEVNHGIVTVHIVGPLHRIGHDMKWTDTGICMVVAFEGLVTKGDVPDVGATVRFLPEHCMMGKVHSGVIVHSEGIRVRIEGIDLKVW